MSRFAEIDRLIGSNIRRLRLERGLSQQDLGRYLGVTFQQIQKYENGFNSISASKLAVLATAMACRLDEFFKKFDSAQSADVA